MPSLLFHAFSFLAPVFYSSGPLPHARGRPSPTPPDRQPCAPLAIRGYNHAPRGASPLRLVPTVGGPARRGPPLFPADRRRPLHWSRSEEHTSELQSLMRISYAVFCLKKKKTPHTSHINATTLTYNL